MSLVLFVHGSAPSNTYTMNYAFHHKYIHLNGMQNIFAVSFVLCVIYCCITLSDNIYSLLTALLRVPFLLDIYNYAKL